MSIVVDTSVAAASLVRSDANFDRAVNIMREVRQGRYGAAVSPHAVLQEGLTLLQRRTKNRAACEDYVRMFRGDAEKKLPPQLRLIEGSAADWMAAEKLFFRHFDRELSAVDCLLVVCAQRLAAPIASFDKGFDGLVARVGA